MTPHDHGPFPSDETLAAFIDGRLGEEARRRVMDHLIRCEECYAVFAASSELQRGEAPAAPFARRGAATWGVIAAAATVAAVLLLTPLRDRILPRSEMARVAAVAPQHRIFAGRLSGIPFRSLEAATRGIDGDRVNSETLRLRDVEANIGLATNSNPTAENLHALGVAQLLLGKSDTAIKTLERAVESDARLSDISKAVAQSKSASLLTDLAAAYEARYDDRNNTPDAVAALDAATHAVEVQRTPVTLWNLAIALQDSGSPAQAAKIWREFLTVSDSSNARKEAQDHLEEVTSSLGAMEGDR